MNKPLLFLFLILLITAGALGLWYWKGNEWGKGKIDLEILGPEKTQAGQEITYTVKLKNNGNANLEEPELAFEYPENALPLEDKDASTTDSAFNRLTKQLETIYPGEERAVEFKARLFGKEGDVLESKTFLTYRPKNLKAKYESKTIFSTQISQVPMTFEFDLPLKAGNGENLNFSLNYFSNIDYVLENLRIKMQYPSGFVFMSAKPNALDETEWVLPALYQVDGGRINIQGAIEGQEGEKKVFRAQLGVVVNDRFIAIKEVGQAVEMAEASFYVSALVNGAQNYAANVGDMLHYEIFFKNIGKQPVQKKFLLVKLDGDFYDLNSVMPGAGDIGKGDNSIIWDWKNVPELKFLDAEEEGKVDFWVKVKEADTGRNVRNPVLKAIVSIAGAEKVFENQINSKVELVQSVLFEDEVFGNTGPLPPKVGSSTTYTVAWQVKNSWNTLENTKVKATLPEYVKPTGDIFPENSKLTYDSTSRELVWNIGALKPFEGVSQQAPVSLAFKIELTPTDALKGKTPILINEAQLTGEDIFTLENISQTAPAVSADLPHDDTVSEAQGVVN